MSFDMSSPFSAAGAGVGEQRHLARVLHGAGDEPLLLHGDAGDPARADLAALGDELAQGGDVLVVDHPDLDALRGSGGLAALAPRRLAAVAARLSTRHVWEFLTCVCLSRMSLEMRSR